jgi:hypothetical protein
VGGFGVRTMGPTGDGREGGTAAVVGMILVRRRKPTTMRIRHSGIRVGLRKLGAARFVPLLLRRPKLCLGSG